MHYAFQIDGKPITAAQEIKLSKKANILTAILRREISFNDIIRSVLNYEQTFEEVYAVSFVDACVLELVDDTMSLNFLAVNCKEAYDCYSSVVKTMIKNEGVLPLLVSIAMDAPAVKTLGITHLADKGFYIFTAEDILFMVQAADEFVEIDHKPTPSMTTPSTAMRGPSFMNLSFAS